MAKSKNVYMHTLDGQPARFIDGQVCYAGNGDKLDSLLVDSLKEIRKQQKASIEFRRKLAWDVGGYGYIRFKV